MDRIHEIDKKYWISQRTINLKQLVKEREAQLIANNVDLFDDEVEDQDVETGMLKEMSSFELSNVEEVKPYFLFNSSDQRTLVRKTECRLKMYHNQLEHAERMITDRAYKVAYLMNLRKTRKELLMRHLAMTNRSSPANQVNEGVTRIIDKSLVAIVVVQLWPQPSKNSKVKLEKEVLFRADQPLTDLRDQLKCVRDFGVPMDLSENPEQAERVFRGELFKSGFFLIGNTFYNDMRDLNNIDLSVDIVEWASKEVTTIGSEGENLKVNRGIGPFNRKRMEDVKFDDLEFRLGCPYLYLHQGDCEHLFTISDIRYEANSTNLEHTKFPFVTAASIGGKTATLKCYMCKSRPPHWYTRNNPRLPVDPFFFCEDCFYSFNYDKTRRKIGTFQAYLYTSAVGIPDSVVMAKLQQ